MNRKTAQNQLRALAWPVLLNYLLMSLFEVLDKAIVGHFSVRGFALVGIAAAPLFEITGALGILSAAFNILAARQKGQGDLEGFEESFSVSRALAWAIGGGFFLLSLLGGRLFFRTAYRLDGAELEELLEYFYPVSFTVLQNMLIFQYSAYFRNKLNTKISFYSTAISTAVNLFFDLSLVYGLFGLPQLGTAGAAWGSVLGLTAGLLVYWLPYYRHKSKQTTVPGRKKAMLLEIFRLYPPLLGQEFLQNTLFILVISGVVARLGTGQMAVYSLLDTISSTLTLPVYAYAAAAQTLACQSLAAGDSPLARRYLGMGQAMAGTLIGGLCLLTFLWRRQVLGWVVSDGAVIEKASNLLFGIFALIAAKLPCQFYMSYLQGTGRENYVFRTSAAAAVLASLGTALLGHFLKLPGIYGMMIGEFSILAGLYFQKTKNTNS